MNPGIQKNERIMWALLFVFISYGSLYILSAITYLMWVGSQNNSSILFEANLKISILRGLMISASEIVIMYLSQTFICLDTKKHITAKSSPK